MLIRKITGLLIIAVWFSIIPISTVMASDDKNVYSDSTFYDASSTAYTIGDEIDHAKAGDIIKKHTVVQMPEYVSKGSSLALWTFRVKDQYKYNKDMEIVFYDKKEDAKENNISNSKEIWKSDYFSVKEFESFLIGDSNELTVSLDTEQLNQNNWKYMVISYSLTVKTTKNLYLERAKKAMIHDFVVIVVIVIFFSLLFIITLPDELTAVNETENKVGEDVSEHGKKRFFVVFLLVVGSIYLAQLFWRISI